MISFIMPCDWLEKSRKSFRSRRLELELTQVGLAKRSGVSLGTLRKFERTGQISLKSFAQLAVSLGFLDPLHKAVDPIEPEFRTMAEVLKPEPKKRQRGCIT